MDAHSALDTHHCVWQQGYDVGHLAQETPPDQERSTQLREDLLSPDHDCGRALEGLAANM
jgi:hypothetical protein